MSDTNRQEGSGAGAAVQAEQAVMLVRYRAGVTGQTARTVHLVSIPDRLDAGAVGTLCGALISLDVMETVTSGEGMPCTACVINQLSATTSLVEPSAESMSEDFLDGAPYHAWGWPVTQHREQVWLSLHQDVLAIAIPNALRTELIQLLNARHCAPAVLAHPDAPEHCIVLAGERYGVPLPWPTGVHHVTGDLMLPPTVTSRGPITWMQPPQPDSLRLSREFDVFGALRAVLRDSPQG